MRKYFIGILLVFTVLLSGCDLLGEDIEIPDVLITETGEYEVGSSEPNWDMVITALAALEGDIGGTVTFDASVVDMNTVGVYVVAYNFTDSEGVSSSGEITITIVDTTIPIVVLIGETVITIERGTEYIEQGATVSDNYDTEITVVISGNVDIDVAGDYYLIYNYTDISGNIAVEITRTIIVVDPAIPVITLIGESIITLEVGTEYLEEGATIIDDTVTELSVTIGGEVENLVLGQYILTYDFTDVDLNVALTVTREVNIVDTTIPVITLIGDSVITHEVGEDFIDPGTTVTDNYDTGLVTVVIGEVDTTVIGEYTLNYYVVDYSSNTAVSVTRIVHIVDTTIPVITLIGDSVITHEAGEEFIDPGTTVTDNYDTDLPILVIGEIDITVVGEYTLSYYAADNSSNAAVSVTRTVNVVDTTAPVITLIEDEFLDYLVGVDYVELGASVYDAVNTNLDVFITGYVDVDVVGEYELYYNVTDLSGNVAETVIRTVNVVDIVEPDISFEYTSDYYIGVGTDFVDPGVLVTDNYYTDGFIITTIGTVDTNIMGSYQIIYSATDPSGNESDPITRTVTVLNGEIPYYTVNNGTSIEVEYGSDYVEYGATVTLEYEIIDMVASGDTSTFVDGDFTITYTYTDDDQVEYIVERLVHVIDTTPPVITLNGEDYIYLEYGESYVELGATATDLKYGETPVLIDATETDYGILGTYTVYYYSEDDLENYSEITRTVEVVDTTAPVISLAGDEVIDIIFGGFYIDELIIFSDNHDVDYEVTIEGTIDFYAIGTYELTYYVYDSSGNQSNNVTRTINVIEYVEQFNNEDYIKTYSLSNTTRIYDSIEVANNELVIVGGDGDQGIVFKTNQYGEVLWTYMTDHEHPNHVYLTSIIEDASGDLVIVGHNTTYGPDDKIGFIIKLDQDGNLISMTEFDENVMIGFDVIIETSNGNYLISGQLPWDDLLVRLYDADLNLIWEVSKAIPGAYPHEMFETEDNTFMIYGIQAWGGSAFHIEYSNLGVELDSYYYGSPEVGFFKDMIENNAGEKVAVYYEYNEEVGRLIRYTSNGFVEVTLGTEDFNVDPFELIQLDNGNYIVVGASYTSIEYNRRDAVILEYTADLELVQYRILDGSDADELMSVELFSNGQLIILGITQSTDGDYEFTNEYRNAIVIKIGVDFNNILNNDKEPPEINILGDDVINIIVGTAFVDEGVVITDNIDVDLTAIVQNYVDSSQVGTYYVYYFVEDSDGNQSIARRTVVVYKDQSSYVNNVIDLNTVRLGNEIMYNIIQSYDIDTNGLLSDIECNQVNSIYAPYSNVEDISVLRYFTNITRLTLGGNNIEDISALEYLINLIYLDLNSNNIIDITALEYLDNLTHLYLGENQIVNINSLQGKVTLEFLQLSRNYITDLSPLDNLMSLVELDLYMNPADLSSMGVIPHLEILNASQTNTVIFENVNRYPELKTLYLSGDYLEGLTGLSGLYMLETISLYNSPISDISSFAELVDSTNLTNISLSQNEIIDVCPLAGLVSLIDLGINNNNITDISCLDQLVNLESLDFVNNHIEDITVVENFVNLKSLRMDGFTTTLAPLQNLDSLTYLYIGLNYIDYSAYTLDRDIINNMLENGVTLHIPDIINFDNLPTNLSDALSVYDLDFNGKLSIYEVNQVVELDLSGLGITEFTDVKYFENLITLDLSNNLIVNLYGIIDLVQLETINLDSNELISILWFDNIINLQSLSVLDNLIDFTEGNDNATSRQALIDKGVTVLTD